MLHRIFMWSWVSLMLVGLLAGCKRPEAGLNPLPEKALADLSLKKRELPRSYVAVTDTNLLQQAGIQRNPDYLSRKADRETLLRIGADASFVALYGHEDEALLVMKGTYFRNREAADTYLEVQKTRQRKVMAFRRDLEEGVWLLVAACDPERTYTDEELQALQDGLKRYQRRLKLDMSFNHLSGSI